MKELKKSIILFCSVGCRKVKRSLHQKITNYWSNTKEKERKGKDEKRKRNRTKQHYLLETQIKKNNPARLHQWNLLSKEKEKWKYTIKQLAKNIKTQKRRETIRKQINKNTVHATNSCQLKSSRNYLSPSPPLKEHLNPSNLRNPTSQNYKGRPELHA